MVGGGGGVIIDNVFIGFYGLGSTNDFVQNINEDDFSLDLAHGGLWFGYTPNTFKVFHPYTSLKVGWGFADINQRRFNNHIVNGDAIFALTPEAGLELNVTRHFRIGGSIGYRWVTDVDQLAGYGDKDFSSLTGQITMRFGWFGKGRKNRIEDISPE